MDAHVALTGVLFIVWGSLTILIGVSTLALGVGAIALMASASHPGVAAGFLAATFTTLAILAIVWGAAHVGVGVYLRRRIHWSRLAALMLATIDLLLLPYGTALGCYALWVLLSEKGKAMYS